MRDYILCIKKIKERKCERGKENVRKSVRERKRQAECVTDDRETRREGIEKRRGRRESERDGEWWE